MTAPRRTEDDERWLDALAGRAAPGARPETLLEAQMLRAALRRSAAAGVAPALSPHERQRMLAELQAAVGAAAPAQAGCPGCAGRRDRLSAWWMVHRPQALAAAALAAAALGLAIAWVALPGLPGLPAVGQDVDVLRGTTVGDVRIVPARDPQAERNALAGRLSAAGLVVTRYERLGRHGLQAPLPQPLPQDLATLLRAQGLPVPAAGELRVEFEATAP